VDEDVCVNDDDWVNDIRWVNDIDTVDWDELSELYRVAPLGNKPPTVLRTVFGNSMFIRFGYIGGRLVAAGRVLADGIDCAYIGDVAVHPDHQGRGLGKSVVRQLIEAAEGHRKIILNARPSTEGFYAGLGFLPMNTAMAVWNDPDAAIQSGLLRRAS
jgi:ribosomal protein S18 acetylase RimI-like enzyme